MPKATTPTAGRQGRRHNPLEDDLLATGPLRAKAPKRKSKGGNNSDKEQQDGYVDSKASRQILEIGRELAAEHDAAPPRPPIESQAFGFASRFEDEALYGDDGNNGSA